MQGAHMITGSRTFKLTLEPAIDAAFRVYCSVNGVRYNFVIRNAIKGLRVRTMSLPGNKEIYGKLGAQPVTVRLTEQEIKSLQSFAGRMGGMPVNRSYSRILRYAVSSYMAEIAAP